MSIDKSTMNQNSQGQKDKGTLYVDIANILPWDKGEGGKNQTKNIPYIWALLELRGYDPVLVADARMRYYMDDIKEYDRLVDRDYIIVAPAGREADEFILEMARLDDCKILSNDLFRKYYDEFGKDWICAHRLTFIFKKGKLIIR